MEEIDPTKALRYIQENAGKYAQAKANRIYIENYSKTLKSRLALESDKKTLGDREMEAYGSVQYEELMQGLKEAVQIEEDLRWMLEAAKMKVEVWKTQEQSRRAEMRLS
jgi:hypothetical protein